MENTFKITIIGGTGKVGRYIANKALQRNYKVRMLVRNSNKLIEKDDRIEIVTGDIQNKETIYKLLEGCYAVINAFGQPVNATPLYSEITENILKAMTDLKIQRYIGVTGGSLQVEGDKRKFLYSIVATLFRMILSKLMKDRKKELAIFMNNKQIDWTLVRLPMVEDGPEKGHIKEKLTDMTGSKVTSQDIATFLVDQVQSQKYIHKAPFISN